MAVIELAGRRCFLRSAHLVGRSRRCDLVIEDRRCSSHHANLRWSGAGWSLSDLGSSNGTWVNGERVPAGARVSLEEGDQLGFGSPDAPWVLRSAAPPVAQLLSEGGEVHLASRGLLVLERPPHPPLSIFRDADGAWVSEPELEPIGGASLGDGARFTYAGESWSLSLPAEQASTAEADDAPHVSELRLLFTVSLDEEHVELRGAWRGGVLDLGSRAHNYLLLTLARLRLEDQAAGLPVSAQGWVEAERLAAMLRAPEGQLNLHIYRARRVLQSAGVEDAAGLVERRSTAKQLRLGVGDIALG